MTSKHISISEASKIIGVCSQTIRNWEKLENPPFQIHRTLGGHRRYLLAEVEKFKRDMIEKSGVDRGVEDK